MAVLDGNRLLNSTRPRPSLRASGTLPGEAIRWRGRLVWIASPCGFAMTWERFLNGTRPKRRAIRYYRSGRVNTTVRRHCYTEAA
ncbi:MAG: hypothetical protein LBT00_08255 [Spirochaetaceae bacterium]|nr:hypothetical protein [Spirochaetaceae bacterium]